MLEKIMKILMLITEEKPLFRTEKIEYVNMGLFGENSKRTYFNISERNPKGLELKK